MHEGCACVTCVMSRANRQQAERIKALQESANRVRELCTEPGYLASEEVLAALDGSGDDKQGKQGKQAADPSKVRRSIISVPLPE